MWGIFSINKNPIDAIPDLSENQVIVFTEWMGRSPQVIEDQVTYPLVSSRVGKGISAQASHRTVREPLNSYGSSHSVIENSITLLN